MRIKDLMFTARVMREQADPPAGSNPPAEPVKKDEPKTEDKTAADLAAAAKERDQAMARAKKADEELKRVQSELKRFEGIDPDAVRELLAERKTAEAERKKAEEEAAIKRGEFESVRKQMAEAQAAELKKRDDEMKALSSEKSALLAQIESLTIGQGFAGSRFLAEETIITPDKARKLYGDHFDVVDGKVVPYDKPRGESGRAPIVDASGEPVAFEVAIRKFVEADPDRYRMLRAKMSGGAGSAPAKPGSEKKPAPMSAAEKIRAGIDAMKGKS